jgi:hypothetical protein
MMKLGDILTIGATALGGALSWITKRRGVDAVTTTLAIPGAAFAVKAANDVVNNNQEQGSVGIAEAALSVGGSAVLGYMTGKGATDAVINSAALLGTYALIRTGVTNAAPAPRRRF